VGTGGAQRTGGALNTGGTVGQGGAVGSGGSTDPSGTPSDRLLVGYFQTWSEHWAAEGSATTLAHLPSYVNVVNLAFLRPDTSYAAGSLSLGGTGVDLPYDGPTLKAAVAALHANHPNTKVYISVGGATYYNWTRLFGVWAHENTQFAYDIMSLTQIYAEVSCY
jgi:hypothetical protein